MTEPYIEKTFTNNCRDCNEEFTVNAQCHPKTGAPVTFISKYCKECNDNLTKAWNSAKIPINGTINNIESAKIAQKNIEGLEEAIQTLATSIVHSQNATDESIGKLMDDFKAFKKHTEYDIEMTIKTFKAINKTIKNIFYMIIGLFIFDLGVVWYIIMHK
jgi:molecular chaperone DnaK (HSP70)